MISSYQNSCIYEAEEIVEIGEIILLVVTVQLMCARETQIHLTTIFSFPEKCTEPITFTNGSEV